MVFFLIKPDAMEREGVATQIITRITNDGFKLVRHSIREATFASMAAHYFRHKDESYFNAMMAEYARGDVFVALADNHHLDTHNVIKRFRKLQMRIRDEFAIDNRKNSIHGSDSPEETLRESKIWLR